MDIKKTLQNKLKLFYFIFIFSFLFFGYNVVNAVTLRVNPGSTNLSVGSTATFSVIVNSENISVNNAEGVIRFSPEFVDVISVSKSGSVFSLWVEEPSFSNSSGIISFNGGVPTPGFNGSSGRVISFTVRAKKTGSVSFVFDSASVRANDGSGTDVLSSRSGGSIEIIPQKIIEPVKKNEPASKVTEPVKVIEDKKVEPPSVEVPTVVPVILSKPQISLSAIEINKGGNVTIFGKSDYINEKVNLYLESDGKEIGKHSLVVSSDGFFSITVNKIKTTGVINIWAENVLSDGNTSDPSLKIDLTVVDRDLIKLSINRYLLYSIIVLFALLILGLYIGWHKYFLLKKKTTRI